MKKIQNRQTAFSLAEALITLLIVCLITLASVPVITKKKRTVNEGVHGAYYCTVNSAGEHVYYNATSPKGDLNKPDTWEKTGKDHCKFTPPINAKIFAVTMIGGGGAGGPGKSALFSELDFNKTTFKP